MDKDSSQEARNVRKERLDKKRKKYVTETQRNKMHQLNDRIMEPDISNSRLPDVNQDHVFQYSNVEDSTRFAMPKMPNIDLLLNPVEFSSFTPQQIPLTNDSENFVDDPTINARNLRMRILSTKRKASKLDTSQNKKNKNPQSVVRGCITSSSHLLPIPMLRPISSRTGSSTNVASTSSGPMLPSLGKDYWDIGDAELKCEFCGAYFWYDERLRSDYKSNHPKYSICCSQGKIKLPRMKKPPPIFEDLLSGQSPTSNHFIKNIRSYNSMFAFTSMGGKIDNSINTGNCPPIFKLHGQNYHLIGGLMPTDNATPKFAQLYIYDTENEIANRLNSVRSINDSSMLDSNIVEALKSMLDENNILVQSFRMARDKIEQGTEANVRLKLIGRRDKDARTYNLPTVSEVAALIVGDFDESLGDRDIIVESKSGGLKRITELHASYLGLQYPLIFPYGEDGYREDISLTATTTSRGKKRTRVSAREFFSYRFHDREGEDCLILCSRRLTQQLIVDGYTIMESGRLSWIKNNQKTLRCEMYKGLADALTRGERDLSLHGTRIVLPSSYTGGPRYMVQNFQDAMTICGWTGYPDLFITFTCNQKWPEITRYLDKKGLNPEDRPDIVCRVFKMKLDGLIKDLRKNQVFGQVRAVVYTVEFQKRGLPHAHILLFLAPEDKISTGTDIDRYISAEIPDEKTDPQYFAAVKNFMIHGPCGDANKKSPCMSDKGCTKYFPKDFVDDTNFCDEGFPIYRRRNNGRTMQINGIEVDNRFIVPHNRYLLLKYGAHMNMEWCNQARSIKYLFKYINKGCDRATAQFLKSKRNEQTGEVVDEVKMYYDCRYISPCEAMWRILGFEIAYRDPPVERLPFHLPGEQNVVFDETDRIESVVGLQKIRRTKFEAWFKANIDYTFANKFTYTEFPQHFVWKSATCEWSPRQKGRALGRAYYVPPGAGDTYYLRCLINVIRGAKCHDDMKVAHKIQYNSYRDACYAYGLLEDDKEYIDGIKEAGFWASAQSVRTLFATLLTENCMSRPEVVWEKCWELMADDILYRHRKFYHDKDLSLTESQIKNLALIEIDKLLIRCGSCLKHFKSMPFADYDDITARQNSLLRDELQYDRTLLGKELENLLPKLTDEQRIVYDKVMHSSEANKGNIFFLYGYGGTGKTFVWRTLSASIRSKGGIVLNVASCGIASLLLPGGRTAHSRFKIPLKVHHESMCSIKAGSELDELICLAKLIIWDEAPMMHKHCFEALDKSFKDVMKRVDIANATKPFGGKTVVFGGDFRQILPVIPKGRRSDIVNATINSSYIWNTCEVLRLTKNMRLQSLGSESEASKLKEFSDWLAAIGDGTVGEEDEGSSTIQIPEDMLLSNSDDPIATIVDNIYPNLSENLHNPDYLQQRAILAPTLDVVDSINNHMISQHSGEARSYFSSDSTSKSEAQNDLINDVHTPEFLNSIKCSGVPNHELKLKIGTPVMLLRNLDPSRGLCNGTRLIITRLGDHVLEAKIITGASVGHLVLIPRLSMTPSDTKVPFKFQRRQFPLTVSYAMTINKSQGQSLTHVGLFLRKPVFSHGQLYVAFSRVTNRNGLKIMICDEENKHVNTTVNVVYKEVFRNL